MTKKEKNTIIERSKIINKDIAVLLSKYFLCESLITKFILKSNNIKSKKKESLFKLNNIKKALKENNVKFNEKDLDLLFRTSLNEKNNKSLRFIRNQICHNCSIFYRKYAIENINIYNEALDNLIHKICEI